MNTGSIIALILIFLSFGISVLYTYFGLRVVRCPNNKCRSILVLFKIKEVHERECLDCGCTLIYYPNYSIRIKG